jgi:hypothetical protein
MITTPASDAENAKNAKNDAVAAPKKPNRFDYVAYDDHAQQTQFTFKSDFQALELRVDNLLKGPRAKALVATKLEEAYMWIGKAIRDDQIERNGSAPLQEGRSNS